MKSTVAMSKLKKIENHTKKFDVLNIISSETTEINMNKYACMSSRM